MRSVMQSGMRCVTMGGLLMALLVALGLAGCDDGGAGGGDAVDMAPAADPDMAADGAADAMSDATDDTADATADAMGDATAPDMLPDMAPPPCDWPAPRLGDLPPARTLAGDPANCGMPGYQWLDSAELGQVLDRVEVQRLPAAALGAITNAAGISIPRPFEYDVVIEQIVYVTQDRGQRVEATALLGWPQTADGGPPPGGMLALMHGTNGFSDDCAPSNTLEYQALTAAIASTGYLVVTPDFLGLKGRGEPTGFIHPYLVGEPTAISALDGVRAAGRLAADAGVCLDPEPVMLGISQGGHAALWVELLAPYYAPELRFVGTAAVVPPSDLLRQLERAIAERVSGTFNALGLLIGGGSWYGLGDRFAEVFQPPLDSVLPAVAQMSCADDAADEFDLNEDDYPDNDAVFTDVVLGPARAGTLGDVEPWGCVARENSLLHTRVARLAPDVDPTHGIFFVVGEQDALVDTPTERAAFDALCEGGWPLRYLECARAKHVDAAIWALPEIFDFLDARRAGEPLADRCMRGPPTGCRGEPME